MKTFQVQDYIQLCFHEKQGANINFNVFSVNRNDLDIHLSAASTAQIRSADLITFTEEILNGKPHFLCSAR